MPAVGVGAAAVATRAAAVGVVQNGSGADDGSEAVPVTWIIETAEIHPPLFLPLFVVFV